MAFDPIKLRVLAEEKEDSNWQFRQFLKRSSRKSEEIDQHVFETTKRVWAEIDCTACANCCKEMKAGFSDENVNRVAKRLGMQRQQFINAYLEPAEASEGVPWRTKTMPCPFLKDNCCSIYEDRPAECRGYPYLYEPDFNFRTMGMIGRTFTCPIVFEVMEELKQSLQPPGYLTQMLSKNYEPKLVQCDVTAPGAAPKLDANAHLSEDGKTLVLQVVNPGDKELATDITLAGFVPTKPIADVTELAGSLNAVNTAEASNTITPRQIQWRHESDNGRTHFTFAPHSVTVIRFE